MSLRFVSASSPFEYLSEVNQTSQIPDGEQTAVEDAQTLPIKGFASVEIPDRDNEIVNPMEFDIPTFMVSPVLLEDHKFLKDEFKNNAPAGSVKDAYPAFISGASPDQESWLISDLKTGEVRDSILKSKVPRLKIGSKGLFVHAEVSHPITIKKIKRGEIGGLSWFGFAREKSTGTGLTRLESIDLVEISVVYTPNVSQAGFMVSKSIAGKMTLEDAPENMAIHRLRFPKQRYDLEKIGQYLETHKLKSLRTLENSDFYFAELDEPHLYEVTKSVAIPMGTDEVSALAAPMIEKPEVIAEFIGDLSLNEVNQVADTQATEKPKQRLYLVNEAMLNKFPNAKVEIQKSITCSEDEVCYEIATLDLEEAIQSQESVETQVEEVQAVETQEQVETQTENHTETVEVEKSVETEDSLEARLSAKFDAKFNSLMELLTKAQSPKVETPAETETETPVLTKEQEMEAQLKQIEQATEELEAKQKSLAETQKQVEGLLASLQSYVPEQEDRSETLSKTKNVEQRSVAASNPLARFI